MAVPKMMMLRIKVAFVLFLACGASFATWKPEYGKSPVPVQEWFKAAPLTEAATHHFPFYKCCEQAERLMTKFIGRIGGEWSYYPDPTCTQTDCPLLPIPDYIIHDDSVHAENLKDDSLPEFEEMRREGVLFIYKGVPTCFWPPEPSM